MLRPMHRGQKRPSMLAGLDTADIIEDDNIHGSTQHTTRQALHGRSVDTMYNMKYHPMDEVTRPGRGKRQRRESGYFQNKSKEGLSGEDASMSEDEEEMSDVGSSSGEENEEDETTKRRRHRSESTTGTRRSSRSAAQKPVNYDQNMHPQDKLLASAGVRRMPQRSRTTATVDEKKRKQFSKPVNGRKLKQVAVHFAKAYVAESVDLESGDRNFPESPVKGYWPDTHGCKHDQRSPSITSAAAEDNNTLSTHDEIVCKQATALKDNVKSRGESQDLIFVSETETEEEEDADHDDSVLYSTHEDQDLDDQTMNAIDDLVQGLAARRSEDHATADTKEVYDEEDSAIRLQANDHGAEDALATMDGHVTRHEALLDNETSQLTKGMRTKHCSQIEDSCHTVGVCDTTVWVSKIGGELVNQTQFNAKLPRQDLDLRRISPDSADDQPKTSTKATTGKPAGSTPCPKTRGCRELGSSPSADEECDAEPQRPLQHAPNEEELNSVVKESSSCRTFESLAAERFVNATLHSCPRQKCLATLSVSKKGLERLETNPSEASSPPNRTRDPVIASSTGGQQPLSDFNAPPRNQSGTNHADQISHDDSQKSSRNPSSEYGDLDQSSNHEFPAGYYQRESSLELRGPMQHPLAHHAERNGISCPEVFQSGTRAGSMSRDSSFVMSSQPSVGQLKLITRKKKREAGSFNIHEDDNEPIKSYAEEILTHWQNSNHVEYPKENAQDSNEEQEQQDSPALRVRPGEVAETQVATANHAPFSYDQQHDVDRQIDDEILLSISQSQHVQQSLEPEEHPTIDTITTNPYHFALPVEVELPEDPFRATLVRPGRSLFSPANSQQAHSSG